MNFFDGGFGSLIGGVGSLVGGLFQNEAAEDAATTAYWRSVRSFKRRHQWEVGDLKKAGLNPVLSAKFGGGNAPVAQAAAVPFNPAQAVSTALQAKKLGEEIKVMKSQAHKNMEDAKTSFKIGKREEAVEKLHKTNTKLLQFQVPGQRNSAKWHSSKSGKFYDALGKQIKAISPVTPNTGIQFNN